MVLISRQKDAIKLITVAPVTAVIVVVTPPHERNATLVGTCELIVHAFRFI
jgi:hypothetical protein